MCYILKEHLTSNLFVNIFVFLISSCACKGTDACGNSTAHVMFCFHNPPKPSILAAIVAAIIIAIVIVIIINIITITITITIIIITIITIITIIIAIFIIKWGRGICIRPSLPDITIAPLFAKILV